MRRGQGNRVNYPGSSAESPDGQIINQELRDISETSTIFDIAVDRLAMLCALEAVGCSKDIRLDLQS